MTPTDTALLLTDLRAYRRSAERCGLLAIDAHRDGNTSAAQTFARRAWSGAVAAERCENRLQSAFGMTRDDLGG